MSRLGYYENRPFSLSRLSYSLDVQVKNTSFITMNFLCSSITFESRSLIRNRRQIKMREEMCVCLFTDHNIHVCHTIYPKQ